jgi:hypothetical protein
MTSRDASLYGSPEEAQKAPREDLLYLACLHEGTGVRAPDFLAVIDAEEGRVIERRRCRTSGMSSIISGGTAAARRATGRIAHI